MYAIISDGGRQYRVEEGQTVEVDYRNATKGAEIEFDVLAVKSDSGFKVGRPNVDGASVKAEVLGITQGDKIYIQKFRRRKNSRRRTGHRAMFTQIRIKQIAAG
ncbi:MAG: large subunit ribosomal protein L21 [Pirellulaceae bacterium]|jgi:large subunit ribosomal protein L21